MWYLIASIVLVVIVYLVVSKMLKKQLITAIDEADQFQSSSEVNLYPHEDERTEVTGVIPEPLANGAIQTEPKPTTVKKITPKKKKKAKKVAAKKTKKSSKN